VRATGIDEHSSLLEMGCGPGIATRALAERGYRITALDLGADMVVVARRNLAVFERVEVCEGDFETWDPGARAPFDLIYSATAWHWIDPAVRYTRCAELVRPGGHLAFWAAEHVFALDGDPFWREIQEAYEAVGDKLPDDYAWPAPLEMPDVWSAELEASGVFDDIHVRQFGWRVDYTVEEYIALMDTFSSNLTRPADEKEYLYAEHRRRVAARDDKMLHRDWGAALFVCRLK
jgi:SAM-dependent methyltransferase